MDPGSLTAEAPPFHDLRLLQGQIVHIRRRDKDRHQQSGSAVSLSTILYIIFFYHCSLHSLHKLHYIISLHHALYNSLLLILILGNIILVLWAYT